MKFKTQHNANQFPDPGEVNVLPSRTMPDQSLTIKQMKERYMRGLPVYGSFIPEYDNGTDPLDGINIKDLDISELHQLAQDIRSQHKSALDKYMAEQKEIADDLRQKAIIRDYEAGKAKEQKAESPSVQPIKEQ